MPRSVSSYIELLKSLLPRGRVWTREVGSNVENTLYAFANELSRVEGRMEDLLNEARALTTSELLGDHEFDFDLPDEFTDINGLTEDERRQILYAKLIATGREDKNYFIDIAEVLGFTIIIIEHSPCWAGIARTGSRCGDLSIMHYFSIAIEYDNADVIFGQLGDFAAGDSLARLPLAPNLIGLTHKYKPAHTLDLYYFYGGGFNNGFGPGFKSIPLDFKYKQGGFSEGFNLGFSKYEQLFTNTSYWSGGFSRSFSLGFNKYRGVDLSSYFIGGFNKGFSSGFNVFYFAFSRR